ncbi:MAG: aminopeptidase P family protein [bacterium]|nr:aminopeptidase P family protein [bacterium]
MNVRLADFRGLLPAELDAMLIVKPENRAYLSGFTGSAGHLLIGRDVAILFTDFRYIEQAKMEAPHFQVIDTSLAIYKTIETIAEQFAMRKVGFEGDYVTVSTLHLMQEALTLELVNTSGLTEKLRMIKNQIELDAMQTATDIAESALQEILPLIKPGMSEMEVAMELEFAMRRKGSEGLPFPIIAASGVRASLPHGRASHKIIEKGDFLTLDFGALKNGYCADMTRTFVIGRASPEQEKIYNIVLRAQVAALVALKIGLVGKDVDKVARDIIAEEGYGEQFGHGLGHGVGRLVHEGPSAGSKSEDVLQAGMVITVEPGIYILEWGGVRIEDMVCITAEGYHNFNKFSKELLCL